MQVESIEVPASRIPPVAEEASSSSKVWAGVLGFLSVLFVIIGLTAPPDPDQPTRESDRSSAIVGSGIFLAVFVTIGYRCVRNASRATRAAKIATTDPGYTWRLSGKYIIGADPAGTPRPDVTFKLNRKLRTMLLAVPRAEVIDRS